MKVKIISILLACVVTLAGCSSINNSDETSPAVRELVESAEKLQKLQRKAQPNSWDVTLEESMAKKNPFTPQDFVLNSGLPPRGYQERAGMWNCQKLQVGSIFCGDGTGAGQRKEMIAHHGTDKKGGKVRGQVGVFGGSLEHILSADCYESGGVDIKYTWRRYNDLRYKSDVEIGFDNEPFEEYEVSLVSKNSKNIKNTKTLFAKLMNDYSFVTVRTLPVDSPPTDSAQFIVKNFAKAWEVACGWHVEYDAISGIK